MSRLVNAKTKPENGEASFFSSKNDPMKDKLERVAKYIPGEIVAAYIFFNGIINEESVHRMRIVYFSISFGFCLAMTPVYLSRAAEVGESKRYQLIVSTFAFLFWAYALGVGLFVETGVYLPILAGLLVGMFSVVSAFLVPSKP